MSAKVFSACQVAGLALVTCGATLQFGPGVGMIVGGLGVLLLTFVSLKMAGRR